MKKRLISLLLVVMMLLTLTGPYAFSDKAPAQDVSQMLNNEKTTEDKECEHQFADGICTKCGGLAENAKVYFAVTSENTIDFVAYDDYNAIVRLPANGIFNTKSISLTSVIQDAQTQCGRQHSVTLNTGEILGDNEVDLTKWLSNAYNFEGGKINAVIDGKAVTYTFDKIKDNKIAATTETAAARAAWQALTANVSTTTQAADDISVVIANGSYIKIGTEYLRFKNNNGDLIIDDLSDIAGLREKMSSVLMLDTCEDQGAKVEILVTKGTKLAVCQSIATLDKDCLITIDFGDADEIAGLKGRLTELRDTQSVYAPVIDLIELFNDVVGVVDAVVAVNVEVGFDVHKHVFDQQNTDAKCLASAATCTTKAVYYYSCTCGEKGTDTFEYGEYAEHVFDQQNTHAKYLKRAATCQSPALYYYSCTVCGEAGTETFEYGDLAEHMYDQEIATEAYLVSAGNCQTKAVYNKSCICGEMGTETFEGEYGTHDFTQKNTDTKYLNRGATCQSPALYYYSCTVCGAAGTETFSDGTTLDHTYTRKNVAAKYLASEATCQSPALYYYSCSMCGEKGTETFEYGEYGTHHFTQKNTDDKYLLNAATCTSKAVYYYSCTCGEASKTEAFVYGDYAAHVYNKEVPTDDYLKSAATCKSAAVYYKSCVCGAKGTEIFAYGNFEKHDTFTVNARAASCTENGYSGDKICWNCREQVENGYTIPAIGHNYENGKCAICGAIDPSIKGGTGITDGFNNFFSNILNTIRDIFARIFAFISC